MRSAASAKAIADAADADKRGSTGCRCGFGTFAAISGDTGIGELGLCDPYALQEPALPTQPF